MNLLYGFILATIQHLQLTRAIYLLQDTLAWHSVDQLCYHIRGTRNIPLFVGAQKISKDICVFDSLGFSILQNCDS